jgi:hypothetical protein
LGTGRREPPLLGNQPTILVSFHLHFLSFSLVLRVESNHSLRLDLESNGQKRGFPVPRPQPARTFNTGIVTLNTCFDLRRVELLPRGVDLAICREISTAFHPLCRRLGRALTGARLPGYDRSAIEHGTNVSPKVPAPFDQYRNHNINISIW